MTTHEQAREGASRHLYPASAMIGDYLRAAAGLVPTGAIFATMPVAPVPATLLGGFAIVFGIFGLRTALRHNTSIEMTYTEIRAYGLLANGLIERTISWGNGATRMMRAYNANRDMTELMRELAHATELRSGEALSTP